MTGSVQVKNGKWYCVLNMKDENGKRKLKWIGTGLSENQGYVLEEMIIDTLFYGLRRSEALGLRWSAVNFEKHEVQINHTVVKVKEKIAKDTTKTEASYRTYPLPDYIGNM